MRRSTLLSILVAGFVFLVTKPAQADQFDFSYLFSPTSTGPIPVSASGVLTTTAFDPLTNSYTITAITGTRIFEGVSQNITGLIAPGGYAGNDNLLFATSPFLDGNGFSYTVNGLGNTDTKVNVFDDPSLGGYTENGNTIGVGTFSVTKVAGAPTPESRYSFPLLLGFAGIGLVFRRKYARCQGV